MKYLFLLLFIFPHVYGGAYDLRYKWDNNNITVCFMDHLDQVDLTKFSKQDEDFAKQDFEPEFFDIEEQEKIARIVNQEFSPAATGIYFVGWQGCSQTDTFDIIIMKAGDYNQGALFGLLEEDPTRFKGEAILGKGYLDDSKVPEEERVIPTIAMTEELDDFTIIHEFGHAATLEHEHPRKELGADKNCKQMVGMNESVTYYSVTEYHSAYVKYYGEYDSNSIMNYCARPNRWDWGNVEGYLTDTDRETLRHIYSQ